MDEYLPQENKKVSDEEAQDFMETFNNGFLMRLYTWDLRYIKPFFSNAKTRKYAGNNAYANVGGSRVEVNGSEPNLKSGPVDFVIGEEDDDELDRVPISVAAEMYGLAGSTALNYMSPNVVMQ